MQRCALLAVIGLALVNAGVAPAQSTPLGPNRVPVTVAFVDSLPQAQGSYIIWRRASEEPRDVILLLPSATAVELSEAVRSLILARRQQGDTAAVAVKMRARRHTRPPAPLPWAPRVLAELARAERRPIAQVGTVRAVQIWLPRQAGRR